VLVNQVQSIRSFGYEVGQAYLPHQAQQRQHARQHPCRSRRGRQSLLLGRNLLTSFFPSLLPGRCPLFPVLSWRKSFPGQRLLSGSRSRHIPGWVDYHAARPLPRYMRYSRNRRTGQQRPAYSTLHPAEDALLAAEAHFNLGWVHIHIHFFGVELNEQGGNRVSPDHQQRMVGLQERGCQRGILHPSSVHKKGDLFPVRAGQRHRADESIDAQVFFIEHHFQHLTRHVDPVKPS